MQARPETIARNLCRIQAASGLTDAELAKRAGLSSIKMMKKRGRGRIENLARVADALGVELADILRAPRRKRT